MPDRLQTHSISALVPSSRNSFGLASRALALALLVAAGLCRAQGAGAGDVPPERSIEDLNLVGAAVSMPLISDSVLGVESSFRRTLAGQGILIRANLLPRATFNLLDGPIEPSQQVYIGQRPTFISGVNPILTADLRQLHLRNAQLNVSFGWRYTNWNPAGPKAVSLMTLYFYKMWLNHRVELKAGYITNDNEFVGMQVGGSLATGAQGVYAVLPYQVGMSYFPLPSPALNLRLKGPRGSYWKSGAQRSLDPAGGLATHLRNASGFRFAPKGEGLLLINEIGYLRPASPTARYAWLRAGYLRNSSRFANKLSGAKEVGNFCDYLLFDYQLDRGDGASPGHGLYAGFTVMTAPARFNSYDRYYEGRLYRKAPFRSRPDDVASLVAAYRGHSQAVVSRLHAQGKEAWNGSPSLTGSYSFHVSRGNYVTLGLGYVRGAAITPRVADSLTFTASWGLYL